MTKEEYKDIRCISFPTGFVGDCQAHYTKALGYSFEQVLENGEDALIPWIAVFKDGKKVAQIKQNSCDIFF